MGQIAAGSPGQPEPAAFWPRGGAWSTGPPHFPPLDAMGSTAQASQRRFGPILEPGQQGLLTFLFRVPCSPRCHRFEEVRFFRVSFQSFRQKRDSPSEWAATLLSRPQTLSGTNNQIMTEWLSLTLSPQDQPTTAEILLNRQKKSSQRHAK